MGAFTEPGEEGVDLAPDFVAAGEAAPVGAHEADELEADVDGREVIEAAVLDAIEKDVGKLLKSNPDIFTFGNIDDGFVEVRDFQTTGVVAFAKGLPFSEVQVGKQSINGHRVQVKKEYLHNASAAMDDLVARL